MLFGAALGSFSLRPLQMLYSAVKVPLLLAIVTGASLPSLFALHAALGLRGGFAATLRGVSAAQATVALTLAACTPLCLFVYVSSTSYPLAVVVNGAFFALATLAGQVTLRRHEGTRRWNPRQSLLRTVWGLLYAFVGIQAAWVLRPFVGYPGMPPTFLRAELWTNAYVVVARTLLELLRG